MNLDRPGVLAKAGIAVAVALSLFAVTQSFARTPTTAACSASVPPGLVAAIQTEGGRCVVTVTTPSPTPACVSSDALAPGEICQR